MENLTDLYGGLVSFVENWGYLAVFLGSMIEGESIIFIAGFFAHEGVLTLPKIIIVSFLGSLIADQALYYVGRHYGNHVIDRFPSLRPRADKAFKLLNRYDTIFILSFRFIYGIRTISPLIIGTSGVSIARYSYLNFVAALFWSITSCVLAYFFAHLIMEYFHLMPKIILGLLVVGGSIGYFILKWRKRKLQ